MKNSKNLTVFVKISQIFPFLPIKLPNFLKTHETLPFQQFLENLGSKTEKYGLKRPNLIKIPPIYFYREVVRRPTFKAQ